jgi:hypothetical protein
MRLRKMQKLTKNQPVFAGGTSPEQALTTVKYCPCSFRRQAAGYISRLPVPFD